MATLLGVDVGGTFTDLVVLDAETGEVTLRQGSTTPRHTGAGRPRCDPPSRPRAVAGVDVLRTARRVGLNALLERAGATVGLLTTDGFRDVLEIAAR